MRLRLALLLTHILLHCLRAIGIGLHFRVNVHMLHAALLIRLQRDDQAEATLRRALILARPFALHWVGTPELYALAGRVAELRGKPADGAYYSRVAKKIATLQARKFLESEHAAQSNGTGKNWMVEALRAEQHA